MALPAELGSMPSAAIYQQVKAWIAQQEAYEVQHGEPAPLADFQLLALQVLCLPSANSSPTPPPPPTAATVDTEVNYVGDLMEYHQKRNYLERPHFVPEASTTLPDGVTGHIYRVTITESIHHKSGHIEHFPAMGYGLNADGTKPCFPNKQAAKHFAAKCALQWLAAQDLIPPNLQASSPPPQAQRCQCPNHTSMGVTQNTDSTNQPPPEPQVETVPPGLYGPPGAAIASPPSPPAIELVADLCWGLRLSPRMYELGETAPSTYNGSSNFDNHGDEELLSLSKVGHVEGIVGKDAAQMDVAKKFFKKLWEFKARGWRSSRI